VKVVPPYTAEFETAQNWRKDTPKPGPEPTLHLPTPKTFALANGMKVYLIEEHALPVVSASLVTMAGGRGESRGQAGSGGVCGAHVDGGHGDASSTQLANDIAQIGRRSLGSSASMDSASVSVGALSNKHWRRI
jgi:zinc protease